MSAAQFELKYDTSKFKYVSVSAGGYNASTNMFVYLNTIDGIADKNSITFTFKATSTGTGAFSVSDVVLSGNAQITGGTSTSVKVVAATTTKKPTTTNKNPETPAEPEIFAKNELESLKIY